MGSETICPVCGFGPLESPPYDGYGCPTYVICPSCGTEFGYDDDAMTHAQLRAAWVSAGCPWWSRTQAAPRDWSPLEQLARVRGPG